MKAETRHMAHGGIHVIVTRDDGAEIAELSVRRVVSSLVNEERYEIETSFRFEDEPMPEGVRKKSKGRFETAVLQVPTKDEKDLSRAH